MLFRSDRGIERRTCFVREETYGARASMGEPLDLSQGRGHFAWLETLDEGAGGFPLQPSTACIVMNSEEGEPWGFEGAANGLERVRTDQVRMNYRTGFGAAGLPDEEVGGLVGERGRVAGQFDESRGISKHPLRKKRRMPISVLGSADHRHIMRTDDRVPIFPVHRVEARHVQ